MKRRLYFLLPDAGHARSVVAELETNGIERRRMHAIAGRDIDLEGLPMASRNQGNDRGAQLEAILWNGNLVLFVIALLLLTVLALLQVSLLWLLVPVAVMLTTFVMGVQFTRHIPNVHLSEFTDALHHREILLMVDVPVWQVARVEELAHRHHPEVITGGVGWHVDALHI